MIGIIGGSGLYNIKDIEITNEHSVDTPFGKPSDAIMEAEYEGNRVFFLPRHGRAHHLLPSEINYRANIYALKKLGVKYTISITAVGSLAGEIAPGEFFLPDQFIDWTKGQRERSFFGDGIVAHVSNADPVNLKLQEIIMGCCENLEIQTHVGGSYICIEGPQFSSRAESHMYRSFGAKVIGMTNVPEAFLAKEASMAYSTVAMVTDFDCWKEEHCTLQEILQTMETNNNNAQKLIKKLVPEVSKNTFDFNNGVRESILTPEENWPEQKRKIIETLIK